jgi:hypothetical protein
MSNKEHLWRLKDDEGKPVADKPPLKLDEEGIKFFMNGKEVFRTQSIRVKDWVDVYEMGNPMPFAHEYMPTPTIQRRRVEVEYEDIMHMMHDEFREYMRRFGNRPEYLSLSKKAYESFYVLQRHEYGYPSRNLDYDIFGGTDVMCNPLQEKPVMALGNPIQEAIEGRLYREQS